MQNETLKIHVINIYSSLSHLQMMHQTISLLIYAVSSLKR